MNFAMPARHAKRRVSCAGVILFRPGPPGHVWPTKIVGSEMHCCTSGDRQALASKPLVQDQRRQPPPHLLSPQLRAMCLSTGISSGIRRCGGCPRVPPLNTMSHLSRLRSTAYQMSPWLKATLTHTHPTGINSNLRPTRDNKMMPREDYGLGWCIRGDNVSSVTSGS